MSSRTVFKPFSCLLLALRLLKWSLSSLQFLFFHLYQENSIAVLKNGLTCWPKEMLLVKADLSSILWKIFFFFFRNYYPALWIKDTGYILTFLVGLGVVWYGGGGEWLTNWGEKHRGLWEIKHCPRACVTWSCCSSSQRLCGLIWIRNNISNLIMVCSVCAGAHKDEMKCK